MHCDGSPRPPVTHIEPKGELPSEGATTAICLLGLDVVGGEHTGLARALDRALRNPGVRGVCERGESSCASIAGSGLRPSLVRATHAHPPLVNDGCVDDAVALDKPDLVSVRGLVVVLRNVHGSLSNGREGWLRADKARAKRHKQML